MGHFPPADPQALVAELLHGIAERDPARTTLVEQIVGVLLTIDDDNDEDQCSALLAVADKAGNVLDVVQHLAPLMADYDASVAPLAELALAAKDDSCDLATDEWPDVTTENFVAAWNAGPTEDNVEAFFGVNEGGLDPEKVRLALKLWDARNEGAE